MKKRNNKTKKYKNYRQYKRGGCGGGTCGLHSGGGKKRCTKKRCNKCKMCGWKKKEGLVDVIKSVVFGIPSQKHKTMLIH